jgi:hypothetical protein
MLKVLLMIDCDFCRQLFRFSLFASEDLTAWGVHGQGLATMAEAQGWQRSLCGNFHYCPHCAAHVEEQARCLDG